MSFETDTWPFIGAKHFKSLKGAPPRSVRVVVIHDAEFPERIGAARGIAEYFRTTPTPASAHVCIDSAEIIQCVHDRDVAYAAPGCNSDGIQVELAGYGRQTRSEWLDDFGRAMLEKAADCVAQYCRKYGLPPVRISNELLKAAGRGIVSHSQVSQVYRKSDHTDPGPNFPWDYFLERVHCHATRLENGG